MGDLATYATLKLNITYIPVELISGLCLPKECSQKNLTDFSEKVTDIINKIGIMLQKKLHIFDFSKGYGLVKPESRVTMVLT